MSIDFGNTCDNRECYTHTRGLREGDLGLEFYNASNQCTAMVCGFCRQYIDKCPKGCQQSIADHKFTTNFNRKLKKKFDALALDFNTQIECRRSVFKKYYKIQEEFKYSQQLTDRLSELLEQLIQFKIERNKNQKIETKKEITKLRDDRRYQEGNITLPDPPKFLEKIVKQHHKNERFNEHGKAAGFDELQYHLNKMTFAFNQ